MANLIDGKALAAKIRNEIAKDVEALKARNINPGLAVVLVGNDPASSLYVSSKKKACAKAGIESFSYELPASASEKELLDLIGKLNSNGKIHGILVQLPLPDHMDESRIINAISPEKDVDGFHPVSVGRLVLGEPGFRSCTPAGIMELIDSTEIDIKGKRAVIVGRSNIVGKPLAFMLLERHATVTICHSKTADLKGEVRNADILIAAIGRARFIGGDWIKPGAMVIDVGINRLDDGRIVGDVDFDSAKDVAGAITPVPKGVGPMTITMLLKNTVLSAQRS
ncbi:MAG TPA: bifunctional methylenetetrahydrofolate dehydrogenase/methenyltetrahydrofolate cyclohydrolase FolD [bacterium]|nr:bifunctional methylenetetrahydrofolate dehydrogenase/methenyltetrahydrofolate cyclohydrolase FolD [Myxococcales bacterium]OQA58977.1 MAG: Bifunctional protein FolD protein [bacterium ADurb.Bin270]HPW45235.1 bifunctional methylenetetrahydrofolate dehydrogenase/methenyltetrahydrofolate cyclohydrolase FolD [bacterium]HQC50291.1 bifunctional methylenetetrahydrofolate dehydrogenase/methenyltetrahydrofolate cyclohydrolase FolD [bacterium]HQH80045.1 bifunctional methylenetetrahydrofolate dehydrogen